MYGGSGREGWDEEMMMMMMMMDRCIDQWRGEEEHHVIGHQQTWHTYLAVAALVLCTTTG